MHIEFISKENVTASQWTGGQTREYTIYPKDAVYGDRDFDFRISSATIETTPSKFTQFEGYHRYLAMLDGTLQLTINGVDKHYDNHELIAFKSTDTITSYTQGTDFNLMLRDNIVDEVVALCDGAFQTDQPFILLFALEEGTVAVNGEPLALQSWDAVWISNEEKTTVEVTPQQLMLVGYWSIPTSIKKEGEKK